MRRAALPTVVLALLAASPAHAALDPYFPGQGDERIDVSSYDLALRYTHKSRSIQATATITATAQMQTAEFKLDFEHLRVTSATVDGQAAEVTQSKHKITLEPAATLDAGQPFVAVVKYRGKPTTVRDPDDALEGWFNTKDGAFAVGQPIGTVAWVPVNNVLLDKATWRFSIDVPRPLHAISNGRLVNVERRGARRTWTWQQTEPMVSSLAMLSIGPGALQRSSADGIPVWTAVSPRADKRWPKLLRKLPKILRFQQKLWGPYPFESAGSVVEAGGVDYALETQSRPIYPTPPDLSTMVHETAHQWFGDSVTPETWSDIWLNEGFATWNEWYWAERHGGPSAQKTFNRYLKNKRAPKNRALFDPPPGNPGSAKTIYATSVYLRGGLALQALRQKIGTRTFLGLLRTWVEQHAYGHATTPEFMSLAESVSGQELDAFFQHWLFEPGPP